jgi:TPR repeat protein
MGRRNYAICLEEENGVAADLEAAVGLFKAMADNSDPVGWFESGHPQQYALSHAR